MPVLLHGPAYSTYARTARLVLEEKGIPYELREVDILTGANLAPEHLARHPWGKVPALEHDGFLLFETFAIARYLDEAFPGPSLQPADPRARARMTQVCAIVDSYAYGDMIGKLVWQAMIVPMQGGTPDQAAMEEGRAGTEKALGVIEGLLPDGPGITLADLFLVPLIDYVSMTPPGGALLAARPRLAAWWQRTGQRPSVAATRPKLG